jgi:hypothetical protein
VNPSILVAAISVGIMVFARLVMGGLAFLSGSVPVISIVAPIGLAVLILAGIIVGHRLAWQWGRLLGLLGGIILSMAAFGAFAQAGEQPGFLIVGVLLAMQGLPLFPMFFALGTQGARQHFRLICPQCGSSKPRAGNFLFTKAICRNCDTSWD